MTENLLKVLTSEGLTLEEAQVFAGSGPPYWQSTFKDKSGTAISGGFGKDKEYARKVAVAEFVERRVVQSLSLGTDSVRQRWGLDLIPTACGFAAGFERQNTILRSIREATERWVMSKWIDEQYLIEESDPSEVIGSLDPISKFFRDQFDQVRFFRKEVLVSLNGEFLKVEVAQTMGLKDDGIFPGSSAQSIDGSPWQHALLESYRHFLFVKNNSVIEGRFPDNKVHFFASNAPIALEQIDKAHKVDWPMPTLALHTSDSFLGDECFVARSILSGWKPWNSGPLERFLY